VRVGCAAGAFLTIRSFRWSNSASEPCLDPCASLLARCYAASGTERCRNCRRVLKTERPRPSLPNRLRRRPELMTSSFIRHLPSLSDSMDAFGFGQGRAASVAACSSSQSVLASASASAAAAAAASFSAFSGFFVCSRFQADKVGICILRRNGFFHRILNSHPTPLEALNGRL